MKNPSIMPLTKPHHVVVVCTLLFLLAIGARAQSVTDGATPSGLAPGSPAGSYALSGFENVNLYNGNLDVHLPLLTIGGRGEAVAAVAAGVNPEPWTMKGTGVWQDWWTTLKPGYGPGVLQGRRVGVRFEGAGQSCSQDGLYHYQWTRTTLTFIASDGTEYELRDKQTGGQWIDAGVNYCSTGPSRGAEFVTGDGTSATFISDATIIDRNRYAPTNIAPIIFPSGYLTLRSGIKYHIVNGLVTWVRDRNGNMLNFTYGSNSSDPLTYRKVLSATDSLARTVTFQYFTLSDTINFKGFGGAPRTITINRAELHTAFRSDFLTQGSCQQSPGVYWPGAKKPSELFPGVTPWVNETCYNRMVISSIVLPGGLSYQFKYNPYGEVARIETPTGSAIEYDMTPGSGLVFGEPVPGEEETQIYRSVQARRVYVSKDDTVPKSLMTYTAGPATGNAFMIVDQLDPQDNNKILTRDKHYFHGNPVASLFASGSPKGAVGPGYPAFNVGRERITEAYSVVNGVVGSVLRKTETLWEYGPAIAAGAPACNARVKESTSTLSDTNQVTKKVFGYDDSVPYNNQNNVKEYDFGNGVAGALLRETSTTFITSSAYTNVGLLSLPSQVSVYNGGGTLLASTSHEYDNYTASLPHGTLTPRTSISGFDSSFDTNYLTRGNPTGTTRYLITNGVVPNCVNSPAQCVSTYAQYDIAGNIVKIIDALGFPTDIDYTDRFGTPDVEARSNPGPTDLGSQYSFAFATKVTNALGHTAYTQFDYYLGKPVNSEDANGVVSSVYYSDALDRPTQTISAVNPSTSIMTQASISYDDLNHTVTTTSDQSTYGDNALIGQTLYDGLGRTIERRQYEGGTNYITVQTQYDALGRAFKVSNPFRPWQSEVAIWTTTVFDALGRVLTLTTPDSAVVTTSYSGNTVTVTDQAGKQRKSVTDGLGRLREVYEDPTGLNYLTSYAYDTLDDLTTVTQGVQTRSFVYDSLKRLSSATNPESGTLSYQYDANGNLVVKTDARGVSSHYSYDALNRSLRRWYNGSSLTTATVNNTPALPSGVGSSDEANYFYDAQTLAIGAPTFSRGYSTGRLVAMTYGTGSSAGDYYGYDAGGRALLKIQQTGGINFQTSASYNLVGARTGETYPSGRTVSYAYDTAGRTSSFTGNLGDGVNRNYATEIIYSPLGGMTKEKFGTDTALYNKLFYNSRGQLSEIREGTSYTGPNDTGWERGAIINYYGDCWGMCGGSNSTTPMTNNNGNLKKQEIFVPGASSWLQQYDYDNLNRLQGVSESTGGTTLWRQEYVYDRYGNRTIHQTNTWGAGINKKDFTVNAANNNRLGVPAGQTGTMSYDAAGNLTTDTYSAAAVTRTYDAENRMTSETQANSFVAGVYTYNADGQRVRRTVGGQPSAVTTWQVYGFTGELLAEYAAAAAPASPQKEYGYRNGQLLVTAVPAAGARVNFALAANGGYATASSSLSLSFTPNATTNGDRKGIHWGTGPLTGSGWVDVSSGVFPDWLQIDFNATKTIDEIDVFTIQDNYLDPVEPTETMTFSTYGLTAYDVQYWNGSAWVAVTGGSTSGNNKVWRKLTFSPVSTSKIRVLTNAAADNAYSRMVELEAWGTVGGGGVDLNWLVADQLGTPRMVFDKTGALANVKRHDYLPFGEELSAGVGQRTTTLGYSVDGVRQKFTRKERDNETGLDYFEARYYASTQGRFTGADNPGFSNGTDPQTWNLYAYTANNPLRRVDPDGRDWFQIGSGYGARFEWHEGTEHKYRDADGNEQTATNVGTHLLVFEFSFNADGSIRRNSDGAAVGTLTLYNQNQVAAQNTEAFTGGRASDGSQYNDIPLGVFTIRTDIRERASDATALKPDNPRELRPIYGLQEIDRSLGFADPWGTKRAALNEWDTSLPKPYRGNYLHGHDRASSSTAGCIGDRPQTVVDAIFSINSRVTPRVKAVVTDGPPKSPDLRPGPYVIRP